MGCDSSGVTRCGAGRWLAGVLVVLLCLASSLPASALVESLSRYESRAYIIYTNLPREEAAEYGSHMDLIFQEYTKRFAILRGADRGKQNLYLLRSREDYIQALVDLGVGRSIAASSGGMFFYNPVGNGLATWTQGLSRDRVFATLQHEGFHQFASSKLGQQLPRWLNEGLAEYFGSAIIIKGKVRLGVVDEARVEKIRGYLKRDAAIPFDSLMNITAEQWGANMTSGSDWGSLQYDQSWSIVHFLVHGDKGRYQKAFEHYLVLISKGRTHRDAFGDAFGSNDTAPFAARWVAFMAEVEPDPYGSALQRIEFLAQGLKFLKQHDRAIPTTIDELRQTLRASQFRMTYTTEAGQFTIDSADDEVYQYTDAKGETQAFELKPGKADDDLPDLTAMSLRPGLILTWEQADEGELRTKLVYR